MNKGCGKEFILVTDGVICGDYCVECDETHLCPSCSPNHSPKELHVKDISPEDKDPVSSDVNATSTSRDSGSDIPLSEKQFTARYFPNKKVISVESVKDFILRLKGDWKNSLKVSSGNKQFDMGWNMAVSDFLNDIDKLAGRLSEGERT